MTRRPREGELPRGTTAAMAELQAAADLLGRGLEVYRAASPHCRAALVVVDRRRRGALLVEVRSGKRGEDGLRFERRLADKAHLVAVVVQSDPEPEIVYFDSRRMKKRLRRVACPNCRHRFRQARRWQKFCSRRCKDKHHERERRRRALRGDGPKRRA